MFEGIARERKTLPDLAQWLFHLVCVKDFAKAPDHDEAYFREGFRQTEKFVRRFGGQLDYRDKTVLDVGCGFGSTCLALARDGARRVVGIDIDARRIAFARRQLVTTWADLADRVEFRLIEDFGDLGAERFDLIISKDSFEHFADPAGFVGAMQRQLAAGGRLAIGFGPLWKSPYGGHIKYMTRLPWAHLLFPERVIMRERRRFFPDDSAETFGEIVGGLNKMTLEKLETIVQASDLTATYFRANVSEHPLGPLLTAATRLPFAREYATFNAYGIWQRAAEQQ